MHNIIIMTFPDEVIRATQQTGQIVPLRNIVCGPIEPTQPQFEFRAVSDNNTSEAFNLYEANRGILWITFGR
jgi:hypothetical protein